MVRRETGGACVLAPQNNKPRDNGQKSKIVAGVNWAMRVQVGADCDPKRGGRRGVGTGEGDTGLDQCRGQEGQKIGGCQDVPAKGKGKEGRRGATEEGGGNRGGSPRSRGGKGAGAEGGEGAERVWSGGEGGGSRMRGGWGWCSLRGGRGIGQLGGRRVP